MREPHKQLCAEAAMRIIKEIVFGRVKLLNLPQMFQFVTLTMENYYVNRLLDMTHSRYRPDIALRYKHRELPQEYKRVDVKSVLLMEMHLSLKITRRTQPLEYQLVGFQESLEEIMDDMDKRAQEGAITIYLDLPNLFQAIEHRNANRILLHPLYHAQLWPP